MMKGSAVRFVLFLLNHFISVNGVFLAALYRGVINFPAARGKDMFITLIPSSVANFPYRRHKRIMIKEVACERERGSWRLSLEYLDVIHLFPHGHH